MIASMWKVVHQGWKAGAGRQSSRIYNIIVLLEIIGKPLWWIVLFLIPFVSLVAAIMVSLEVAKCFGKSPGFGIGLAFLSFIFYPILGFGDARYLGPQGAGANVMPAIPLKVNSARRRARGIRSSRSPRADLCRTCPSSIFRTKAPVKFGDPEPSLHLRGYLRPIDPGSSATLRMGRR